MTGNGNNKHYICRTNGVQEFDIKPITKQKQRATDSDMTSEKSAMKIDKINQYDNTIEAIKVADY